MSVERPDALPVSEPSSSNPLLIRLHETLISCSKSIESGDFRQSDTLVSELVSLLNSISDSVVLDPDNEDSKKNAFEVLSEIHRYICSSSLDQAVVDALSFELPKAVAKFAGVSNKCLEIVDSVIDWLITACNPRDMLSILCEALDSPSMMFKFPSYFAPLLRGLSKVFLSIQRRHFEQVKVAVPVILNVLKAVSSESEDEDSDSEDLFDRAIGIANSIKAVCIKLEGRVNKSLRALLGLFVLQIMALFSISVKEKVSSCLPLVLQLSQFLPYCGLSYLGSIIGCDVDTIFSVVLAEGGDDYVSHFSYVKHGASLAVIWGHISNEVVQAAEEDLSIVKDELRSNQAKRWQAVGMLKHIFSCVNLSWELKKYAIDFLLCITDGNISQKCNDEPMDCSSYIPNLFTALQAVQMVIMYTSDAVLRRNAFDAFKRVLADIPTSSRFDIIKALITNSSSPSMTAILLDLVKEEMRKEIFQKAESKSCQSASCWSTGVLEFVELVLRPPKGGPPFPS
ncbi:hypothetical protein L1049_012911 [Liquidambar formosana]|uniref:Aberrant root formation protein 4 n=1 Tax=Liquidambar formosana TaxID=63359 RepID=A0AAP0WX53_LIQFO